MPDNPAMGDTFVLSGLKEKRSAIAGQIVDLKREIDKLQADLFHVDSVLRLYGLEPEEIPAKGLDPESERKVRADFTRRILVSLHDLWKVGTVEKVGHGRGVKWRLLSARPGLRAWPHCPYRAQRRNFG